MVKVLIVEDEIATSNDLEDILTEAGFNVVGTAFTGAQAIDLMQKREPEIVLLDIALKGQMNGLEVAEHVNDNFRIPFVFLTAFSDDDTIQQVIRTNPGGYIVKPFKESDIVPAIQIALAKYKLRGETQFPSFEKLNRKLLSKLTRHEYGVLEQVWLGKRNSDIAKELFISVNTVKTHLRKIYTKLDVKTRAEALNKAFSKK